MSDCGCADSIGSFDDTGGGNNDAHTSRTTRNIRKLNFCDRIMVLILIISFLSILGKLKFSIF